MRRLRRGVAVRAPQAISVGVALCLGGLRGHPGQHLEQRRYAFPVNVG